MNLGWMGHNLLFLGRGWSGLCHSLNHIQKLLLMDLPLFACVAWVAWSGWIDCPILLCVLRGLERVLANNDKGEMAGF